MAQIGDQVDDPGYHLTHIPQGVPGEISKTQEVAWELQDGRELGSYGIRRAMFAGRTLRWVYGTGVAEPRPSQVIAEHAAIAVDGHAARPRRPAPATGTGRPTRPTRSAAVQRGQVGRATDVPAVGATELGTP
jgi:hypothetical protein